MDAKEVSTEVRAHGAAIPNTKGRVVCNYCGKTMSGFNRLRYHLGHVRGDVAACLNVPADVRAAFYQLIAEKLGSKTAVISNGEARPTISRRPGDSGLEVPGLDKSESAKMRNGNRFVEAEVKYDSNLNHRKRSARKLRKCIGEFLGECGLGVEVADSPSFKRMLEFAMEVDGEHKAPTSAELEEFILGL